MTSGSRQPAGSCSGVAAPGFARISPNGCRPASGQHLHQSPADVLDHATCEMAVGTKLGIDATKKLLGEGFRRPWPPLIKMDAEVKAKVERVFNL